MERRLQTLAVSAYCITVPISLCLSIYLVLFSSYWWLTLLYILWINTLDSKTSEEGGRQSEWARNWIWWKYLRDYFPVNMERLTELDPKKNYLFCCFPHGLVATGITVAFGTNYCGFNELFPTHKRFVMSMGIFYKIPFLRELKFSAGGCKASSKSIEYVLSNESGGNICVLVAGGAAEVFHCRPGQYKIVYNKRKRFVRCALKTGTALVPVISFGETDLFDNIVNPEPEGSFLHSIEEFVKKYAGIPLLVSACRSWIQNYFSFMPHRRPVTIVVGKPMEIPKIEQPTREQVDAIHETFKQCLITLFEGHKHIYLKDAENTNLEIT